MLYHQFTKIKRFEGEPITAFNDRFQKAYSRLQEPYVVDSFSAITIYYTIVDPLTTMFVKWRANPPTTLLEAYTEVVSVNLELKHLGNGSSVNGGNELNIYPTLNTNGVPITHSMTPNVYPVVV